jgi:hypothetical protein
MGSYSYIDLSIQYLCLSRSHPLLLDVGALIVVVDCASLTTSTIGKSAFNQQSSFSCIERSELLGEPGEAVTMVSTLEQLACGAVS